MKPLPKNTVLNEIILERGGLKLDVYRNTYDTFQELKSIAKNIIEANQKVVNKKDSRIAFDYKDNGEFESQLKFGGDMLVVNMHTNIFQFPREHPIMNLSYIKKDPTRSYCGIINMYNFLADSIKYNRINDIGYLVARIFINSDYHFFVEGKRQIGLMYNNFSHSVIDQNSLKRILNTAMTYCVEFDLLTPNYDSVKVLSVSEIQENSMNQSMRIGKRLGFRFQVDKDDSE